jgi:hypothetical protein
MIAVKEEAATGPTNTQKKNKLILEIS